MEVSETSVLIMGHRVAFPVGKRPFPAQLAVMSSTFSALKRKQHALVESPTGSGKTLALLSSCLTFQRDFVKEQVANKMQRDSHRRQQQSQQQEREQKWDDDAFELLQRSLKRVKREDGTAAIGGNYPTTFTSSLTQEQSLWTPLSQQQTQQDSEDTQAVFGPDCLNEGEPVLTPKIYFCSRTHSQLAQVVKELKGCPESYLSTPDIPVLPGESELRMCVLGSKRVMCVNPKVNDEPSLVNEKCQELRREKERKMAKEQTGEEEDDGEEAGCPYNQTSFPELRRNLRQIWDIEDITKTAPSCKECPYFYSKNALEKAHIVFCPYNYILDPIIRKAVGITLKNAIVVLDEAHNVEDTCRSGASFELTDNILAASIKSFDDVIWQNESQMMPPAYDVVRRALTQVRDWFNRNAERVTDPDDPDDEDCYLLWSTPDALDMLRDCNLDNVYGADLDEIVQHESQMLNSPGNKLLLTSLALSTATRIVSVANYMLRSNGKDADDFKLLITKKMRRGEEGEVIDTKLCIWCLSAAVVFKDIAFSAHSIILASGTLSPMDSFAGELGVDFPVRLEANHVVNMRKQVFVGAVMAGPRGVDLVSTYKNQQNFQYQDSMGELLLQYAQVIPGGILMFFPSYSLMATLKGRWQRRGLWGQLQKHKQMFCEPRAGGKEFDALLDQYKSKIALHTAARDAPIGWDTNTSYNNEPRQSGAIFLAVYRGKVSEGIDFSDDNARAVLCVGIPYPSFKDLLVSLKREYQDHKSHSDDKLVNGSRWYTLQAFRALNQALGRCIRHRRDYGAIILIDSRHRDNVHGHSLSKWMRPHVQEFQRSEECNPYLSEFFQRNRIEMPVSAPASAPTLATLSLGTSNAPIELEYEENDDVKMEVKTEARPSSSELPISNPFMAHRGTADAPIELDIEEADMVKAESGGQIKQEVQPEPAPAATTTLHYRGTIDAPIELDLDDSQTIKAELKMEIVASVP